MDDLDGFGKRLNFGCGFIAGALIATVEIFYSWSALTAWGTVAVVLVALGCAFSAMYFGDKFWYALLKWFGS